MSYHRQGNSLSNHAIPSSNTGPYSDNKENVPLHSQIFQRLHGSTNTQSKSNAKKTAPSSPYNHFSQTKTLQNANMMKSLSPVKFSAFPLSKTFIKPDIQEENESKTSEDTARELQDTQRGQKEIFNEFRDRGTKLKQTKNTDKISILRPYNSDNKDKYIMSIDAHYQEKKFPDNDDRFHEQIQEKIQDLNERYKHLMRKMTGYQKVHAFNNQSPDNIETQPILMRDGNVTEFQNLNSGERGEVINQLEHEIEQVKEQIKKNEEILKSKREKENYAESGYGFPRNIKTKEIYTYKSNFKSKDKENRRSNEPEKRKMEREKITIYPLKRREENIKFRVREEEFERKSGDLTKLEEEISKREKDITEREKNFETNEKAFEKLTKELEDQSEELAKQKVDYQKKVEMFNANLQKFEKEKEEFAVNCILKNAELRADEEKLQNIRKEIQIEQEMLEEKCREILKGYNDFNIKKNILERKEEDLIRREKALNDNLDALSKEKTESLRHTELVEKNLKDKEKQLLEWEYSLEARKSAYDDFDLKLSSMKLNEEVWQKKRNLEVLSLQEKVKLIQEKEKELLRKEEKLNKMLENQNKIKEDLMKGQFDGRERRAPEKATIHSDSLLNDKILSLITSRVLNTKEGSREDVNLKIIDTTKNGTQEGIISKEQK